MDLILRPFQFAARYGRTLLVGGLVAGILLPSLAVQIRPWLQELIALLLFLAALRIGPRQALGALKDIPVISAVALSYQILVPLTFVAVFALSGNLHTPLATAIILMASAPSLSGSPNLTLMVGGDPAPALRLMVVTTALLPLTIIPVFYWVPELGSPAEILAASGKLLVVILIATISAFALRRVFNLSPTPATINAIDGCSAIAMAVVVVGLMSSVGASLTGNPAEFVKWLAAAFAANFGLQLTALYIFKKTSLTVERTPFAIIAGNRNIALFLVALPNEAIEPILLFIGCYQIPMYLTPVVLRGLYRRE